MFSLEEKRTPLLLAYDLQLFANDEGGEKTEEPTAKKIEDSRKEGQVAKSTHICGYASGIFFVLADIYVVYRRTSRQCISLFLA